jgi:5-methylcytosine-specific restriction protein A
MSPLPFPTQRLRVYDLVREVGIDVGPWADFEGEHPASNPKFCYNWAFFDTVRRLVVICLWHAETGQDASGHFQRQNYRDIAAAKHRWKPSQCKRAGQMDTALQFAKNRNLPINVIVLVGSRREDSGDESSSKVEQRCLDPEPWHVAEYDDEGACVLRRGAPQSPPPPPEIFTPEEITVAGTFAEGAQSQVTAKTRERSARLRDLARAHFAKQSADGRLHCASCDWAPPLSLVLTSPIVEIHHGLGISQYPADGRALTFDEAIQHLTPLCPNCHRIAHAKPGGGAFKLEELRQALV